MIVIIDYGMGNLSSVQKACKRVGYEAVITSDVHTIAQATKLILPGVGFFKKGMEQLRERGILEILDEKVLKQKTPILGICLGMQLFTQHSEEGPAEGLGWIKGRTTRFPQSHSVRIPHMGWNTVQRKDHALFSGIDGEKPFYFVHSYFVSCEDPSVVIGTTTYGREFVSSLNQQNIYGTQFHPEKSHQQGLHLLQNFLEVS